MTLSVGEVAALQTAIDITTNTLGVNDKDLVSVMEKLHAAIVSDRAAYQRDDWPDDITETEQ